MAWKWLARLFLISLSTAAAAQTPQVPQAPRPPQPTIQITADGVTVQGLTPGGGVAWFSVWHETVDYSSRYSRRELLDGADRQGTARFPLTEQSPEEAIWIAVDLTSGAYALATPEGFTIQRVVPQSAASRRPGDAPDQIVDHRAFLEGLLVRPGEGGGAWGFTGGDGGAIDDDGANNGRLVISLDRTRPLGTSPAPPAKLADGDLWFVIDPLKMTVSVQRGGVAQ
jgi:hypothetical protein